MGIFYCNTFLFAMLYLKPHELKNTMSLDIPELIWKQEKIINDYLGYRELQKKYGWQNDDLRVTILDTLANELVVQLIHIKTLVFVWSDVWWISHFPNNSEEHQKKQYRHAYLHRIRWGLYVNFCGVLESKIRLLTAHIHGESFNVKYYTLVYKTLLDILWLADELWELFKFSNIIRNLQHHNFYFMPYDGEKDTANFRGEEFIFIPWKKFNKFKIDDAMKIYEDIYLALVKIITSEIVLREKFIPGHLSE